MGHRHVFLVSLALLLVATTTHGAGGHATQSTAAAAAITQQVVRSMIGSGPPSCMGKCGWWCVGRSCEAVLAPIEPPQEQDNKQISRRHGSAGGDGSSRASAAQQIMRRPSSYDDGDHSNYKPIIWRCKCVGAS